MDFRLRVFLAVADNLSFTKASKELFISQPAITKHIQELENTYMVQLFSRQGGRISLTPQGELFRIHAKRIIEGYENLQYEINLSKESFHGEFIVGICSSMAQSLIPHLPGIMSSKFPDMHTSFIIDDNAHIRAAAENGTIDLGILMNEGNMEMLLYKKDEKGETVSSFVHRWCNRFCRKINKGPCSPSSPEE